MAAKLCAGFARSTEISPISTTRQTARMPRFFEDAANCLLERVYTDIFCASIGLSTTYDVSIFVWFLALCRVVVKYPRANARKVGQGYANSSAQDLFLRPPYARTLRNWPGKRSGKPLFHDVL